MTFAATILTLYPEMFPGPLRLSLAGRALEEQRWSLDNQEIFTAELDLSAIGAGLASLDTDGHYSRPDVFELSVDTRSKDGIAWNV